MVGVQRLLPGVKRQQVRHHARPQHAGRPRTRPANGQGSRPDRRELHPPRPRGVRLGLGDRAPSQSAGGAGAHARFRSVRPLARSSRVRPDDGADHRLGLADRLSGRPARASSAGRATPMAGCTPPTPRSWASPTAIEPASAAWSRRRCSRPPCRLPPRQRSSGRRTATGWAARATAARNAHLRAYTPPPRPSSGWRCPLPTTSSGRRSPSCWTARTWPPTRRSGAEPAGGGSTIASTR